jgi:hypothetical protein
MLPQQRKGGGRTPTIAGKGQETCKPLSI